MAASRQQPQAPTESVKLGDGSTMQIARLPEVDENTWGEMKNYLERNPDIAIGLKNFSKNPDAMRGWLQTQAIAEHYQTRLESDDQIVSGKLDSLESDQALSHVFDEIKKSGISAAMKYWDDEETLLKISQCAGGVPKELQATLRRIEETPLSLHEAAQRGDAKAVGEYLKKGHAVDGQDPKGVTPLGYALGAGHVAISKLLVESRASLDAVGRRTRQHAPPLRGRLRAQGAGGVPLGPRRGGLARKRRGPHAAGGGGGEQAPGVRRPPRGVPRLSRGVMPRESSGGRGGGLMSAGEGPAGAGGCFLRAGRFWSGALRSLA